MSNTSAQTAVHVAAPIVTAAVTWAGPRVLGAAYRAGTGRRAPTVTSARYSVLSKVAWAMAVAGLVALTEALIFQTIRELEMHAHDGPATEQIPQPVD
jgi:hypothetical protein